VIVVATADFEFYHDVVAELRERGAHFTTVRPGEDLPAETRVVVSTADDDLAVPGDVEHVQGMAAESRRAVERALAALRGREGRTVVGVDPGTRPGIAVLVGDTVVAAFQVPLSEAVDVIRREVADAPDPLVRVGDGARIQSARLVNDIEDVAVELVDEAGTTPFLGSGARGMGDVLAAVNIARLGGAVTDARRIDPTPGELQAIQDASRRHSDGAVTIGEALARRVAAGELTVAEAVREHRTE
jgi:hypothetical protein